MLIGADHPALQAALDTAKRFGWPVFPLIGKRPVPGFLWREWASSNPLAIQEMPWEEATGYGIALPPDVVVIDLDAHGSGDWLGEAFRTLQGYPWLMEALRETVRAVTANDGLHYYLSIDPHEATRLPAKLGPSVDIKRYGGYVVGPGSPGYEWLTDHTKLQPFPFALAVTSVH